MTRRWHVIATATIIVLWSVFNFSAAFDARYRTILNALLLISTAAYALVAVYVYTRNVQRGASLSEVEEHLKREEEAQRTRRR